MMREKLNNELKSAMKSGLKRRVETIRSINAALKNRDIDARTTGRPVDDDDVVTLLRKMVKTRQESEAIYGKAGRLDLASRESEEIAIISEFLPRQMGDDEISSAVDAAIEAVEARSSKDIGKVLAALKAEHANRMDFAKANSITKDKLARLPDAAIATPGDGRQA